MLDIGCITKSAFVDVFVVMSRDVSVHVLVFFYCVCYHLLALLLCPLLLLLLMLSTASVNKLPAANSAALVAICCTRDCLCSLCCSCSSSASLPFTVICVSVAASTDCALFTGVVLAT
jgi:hypothetical protein